MQHFTIKAAAAYLSLDPATLHHHLREGHLTRDLQKPGGKRRYFTKEALDAFRASPHYQRRQDTWSEIIRRYHAGETAMSLSREFGVSVPRIWARAGARGAYLSASAWEEIIRRRQAGEIVAHLAREYGVSESRIRTRVREAAGSREP